MIPGFGKESIRIGSDPSCDIRLGGPGVMPEHARIVRQPGGELLFVDAGAGQSSVAGQSLASGAAVPFDLFTQFMVAITPIPNAHPALALMLMQRGALAPRAGFLTLGRDPAQAHIVISHKNVSARHATVQLAPLSVCDHGSTAGTWFGSRKLEPEAPQSLDPHALLGIGAVPVSVPLLQQLAQVLEQGSAQDSALEAAGDRRSRKHKTVIGQLRLSGSGEIKTIGRTPNNDITIPHPQVSSHHARLIKEGDGLFLEDTGSANGTYVRGHRIPAGQRVPVANGEKVFVGPMPLLLQVQAEGIALVVEDQKESWAGRPLYEIEAWDLSMQVPDRDNPDQQKTLLDRVSFKALPGDLIALMGPSGAGKTTLLLTLNGYLPPTSGQVRINGEDLYAIYDALRGSIGYVPQDDIVHPELTVWEAVRYSARFRLPPDYADDEINRRVQTTLAQLGLEAVAHLQIGKPEKKVLSGGQRKRVNIAMELVTDPVIMFLDEPTSGLAADDTTALVQLLADLARETGKTIITTIHQPAKDEFEKFNLALILGTGGIPIYFGPTRDGYTFFGSFLERQGLPNQVDNPRDMFDMLNQRERPIHEAMLQSAPNAPRMAARMQAAREWHGEFFDQKNPIFQSMYSGKRAVGVGGGEHPLPSGRTHNSGQFRLLLSRYFKVKSRDIGGTAIMLLQAPIIGVLLALVFGGQKDAIPYWCLGALQELASRSGGLGDGVNDTLARMQATPDNAGAIFFVVVAAVWFGTSNAAREIVSETAIYRRERMVNLGIWNYVISKFVLLSAFCVVQCSVLLAIVFVALGFNGGPSAFLVQLATLIATSMNSVALGLLLSTLVASSEAAMALTPIALIPQVVLGGLMVPMTTNSLLRWPMYIMPARWGFEGVVAQERTAIANEPAWIIDINKPDLTSADNFVNQGKFQCASAQIASEDLTGAWGFVHHQLAWLPVSVLAAMMCLTLLAILVALKRRDSI